MQLPQTKWTSSWSNYFSLYPSIGILAICQDNLLCTYHGDDEFSVPDNQQYQDYDKSNNKSSYETEEDLECHVCWDHNFQGL